MLRTGTMMAALATSAMFLGCGGDDKPAENPQASQCPPGQYFDGQFCQNMQGQQQQHIRPRLRLQRQDKNGGRGDVNGDMDQQPARRPLRFAQRSLPGPYSTPGEVNATSADILSSC